MRNSKLNTITQGTAQQFSGKEQFKSSEPVLRSLIPGTSGRYSDESFWGGSTVAAADWKRKTLTWIQTIDFTLNTIVCHTFPTLSTGGEIYDMYTPAQMLKKKILIASRFCGKSHTTCLMNGFSNLNNHIL